MSDNYRLLNGIVFCIVNLVFLFAGTFFNAVVVLSIWKSSQLRKKLCYFMIFILSCYDLVVVIVLHSLTIFLYISWLFEDRGVSSKQFYLFSYIGSTVFACSLFGLLTMTFERYLGLAYPLFHKTSVTKRKLATFLIATQTFTVIFQTVWFRLKICNGNPAAYRVAFVSVFLILVMILNCKMFYIAKSRYKSTSSNGRRGIFGYKRYYTCLLAVFCFFICCCPTIIYYGLTLLNILDVRSKIAMCVFFWASTVITMNSTINALIFFWINNVLRSEGLKLLKSCGLLKYCWNISQMDDNDIDRR